MQEGGRQGDEEGAEGWQQEQQGRLPGCLPHRYHLHIAQLAVN